MIPDMCKVLRPVVSLTVPAALLAIVVGCGQDDGIGKRYPVYGTVTYNGKALTSGSVNFLPEDEKTARPASGEIQEDGSYKLTTQSPGDGAMGGKYKVSVSAYEVDKSAFQPKAGGSADQAVVARARRKTLIPIRYTGTSTSGLEATVTPNATKFDFELKD